MAILSNASNPATYDSVFKTLHWLIAALVSVQFVLAWTMPEIPRGQPASGIADLHLSIGVTILILILVRWAWRLTHPVPPAPDDLPAWQRSASRLTHYAFYVLLVAMPFAGWAWASAKGWTVTLFGLVALPRLIDQGSPFRGAAAQAHETIGLAILVLIAIHVIAALRHHFLLKDGVLLRILPRGSGRE